MISKLISMFKKDPVKEAEKQLENLDNVLDTFEEGIKGYEAAILRKNAEIRRLEAEADAMLDRQVKLIKTLNNLEKVLG